MKDFLQAIKKFLKIALIVVLVLFVGIGLYTAFDNHKYKKENTVDQQIGFSCITREDKQVRFILASTPQSRTTAKYYYSAYVAGYEHSTESEASYGRLNVWVVKERTIDFISFENATSSQKFALNRKTLDLEIFTKSTLGSDWLDALTAPCKEIEPQKIRDDIREKNAEAEEENQI